MALIDAAVLLNRETLQLNDSDGILKRFTQLTSQLKALRPDPPLSLPQSELHLRHDDSVFV
jgi:hypothetical protein